MFQNLSDAVWLRWRHPGFPGSRRSEGVEVALSRAKVWPAWMAAPSLHAFVPPILMKMVLGELGLYVKRAASSGGPLHADCPKSFTAEEQAMTVGITVSLSLVWSGRLLRVHSAGRL